MAKFEKTKWAAVKCIHCGKYHDVGCWSDEEWEEVAKYHEPNHLNDTVDCCNAVNKIMKGELKLNPGYDIDFLDLKRIDAMTKDVY